MESNDAGEDWCLVCGKTIKATEQPINPINLDHGEQST